MLPCPHPLLRFWLAALVLFAGAIAARAQELRKIRDTGPNANRVNVVILGDGYVASDSAKFFADAQQKLSVLVENEAFQAFKDSVNGFAIFAASNQSGSDIPAENLFRDTYFNTSFGINGIDRLLAISDSTGYNRLVNLLIQHVPEADIVVLIVNATKYGGSGGAIAVASLNSASDDVMLHEIGHSFAGLDDEYVDEAAAPDYPPVEGINVTQRTDRATIAWVSFILPTTPVPTPGTSPDANYVGLFQGAYYRANGFYRPTYDSKMRSLGRPFGPVNIRAFSAAMHEIDLNQATSLPTLTAQPSSQTVPNGQMRVLSVEATGTGPFTYQWIRDGKFIAGATAPSYAIPSFSNATAGEYRVEVSNARGSVLSTAAVLSVLVPSASVDFNGDGKPDVLLEHSASGQRVLWIMGGPNSQFVTLGLDLGFLDAAWHIVGTVDFNGNGRPDVLLENSLSGQRVLWIMGGPNSEFVTLGLDLGFLDAAWHIVGLADFNSDAKPDVLLENALSGQRVLWMMGGPNNQFVIQGLDLGFLDPAWHIAEVADFSGDNKPDILLENTVTGQRVLWIMGGPNNQFVILGLDLGFLDPSWRIVN